MTRHPRPAGVARQRPPARDRWFERASACPAPAPASASAATRPARRHRARKNQGPPRATHPPKEKAACEAAAETSRDPGRGLPQNRSQQKEPQGREGVDEMVDLGDRCDEEEGDQIKTEHPDLSPRRAPAPGHDFHDGKADQRQASTQCPLPQRPTPVRRDLLQHPVHREADTLVDRILPMDAHQQDRLQVVPVGRQALSDEDEGASTSAAVRPRHRTIAAHRRRAARNPSSKAGLSLTAIAAASGNAEPSVRRSRQAPRLSTQSRRTGRLTCPLSRSFCTGSHSGNQSTTRARPSARQPG